MNLMKMIIVMFLHCVSDLALLCRLSTNDLLEKVLGDPLIDLWSLSPKLSSAGKDCILPQMHVIIWAGSVWFKSLLHPHEMCLLVCLQLDYFEILHTEQLPWVRPHLLDGKARSCRQLCKLLERIFVRTLRPDAFAQFEGNLNIPNANRLVFQTHQVHLDPTLAWIIEGIVAKLVQLEIGVQFLVNAYKQVLIELSCPSLRIIIRTMQDVEVLLQIYSNEQTTTL